MIVIFATNTPHITDFSIEVWMGIDKNKEIGKSGIAANHLLAKKCNLRWCKLPQHISKSFNGNAFLCINVAISATARQNSLLFRRECFVERFVFVFLNLSEGENWLLSKKNL